MGSEISGGACDCPQVHFFSGTHLLSFFLFPCLLLLYSVTISIFMPSRFLLFKVSTRSNGFHYVVFTHTWRCPLFSFIHPDLSTHWLVFFPAECPHSCFHAPCILWLPLFYPPPPSFHGSLFYFHVLHTHTYIHTRAHTHTLYI